MRSANNRLATQNPLPLYMHYLIPSILATLLIAGTYLVDTIVVGRSLGESGLAALNVVVPVTGLMYAAGFMFGFGSSNLFSNSLGGGNEKTARAYYGTSVLGLFIFSLLVMIPGLLFTRKIASMLCGGAAFSAQTEQYLRYVFWFARFIALKHSTRSTSETMTLPCFPWQGPLQPPLPILFLIICWLLFIHGA